MTWTPQTTEEIRRLYRADLMAMKRGTYTPPLPHPSRLWGDALALRIAAGQRRRRDNERARTFAETLQSFD